MILSEYHLCHYITVTVPQIISTDYFILYVLGKINDSVQNCVEWAKNYFQKYIISFYYTCIFKISF